MNEYELDSDSPIENVQPIQVISVKPVLESEFFSPRYFFFNL